MKSNSYLGFITIFLLASCSKASSIDKAFYTFENNSGHTIEILIDGKDGWQYYDSIADGEKFFIEYDGKDVLYYPKESYYPSCCFFRYMKIRVEGKYVRRWGYNDQYQRTNRYVGFDYSIMTENGECEEVDNPCRGSLKSRIKDGILKDTITFGKGHYYDTKLNFYFQNYFHSDIEHRPYILKDGLLLFDEDLFKQWEESSKSFQEYLFLSSKEFDMDKEEALMNSNERKK